MAVLRLATRGGVFGLAFAVLLALTASGHAQISPPYSGIFPGTGLTTLPGMNAAQAGMARSIDNVCPTINAIAVTPDQHDLANVCNAMTGAALAVQGQANPLSLSSISGITTVGQLEGALQQIDGGAVTLVPTNQVSQLRNVQSQVIGSRLTVLRSRMLGASGDTDTSVRLAMNDTGTMQDASGRIQLAQESPSEISMWSGKLGLFLNALGQFGSRDGTSSQSGFSFGNGGILFGADYRLRPDLAVGAAFGYTYSSTDFDTNANSAPGQYLHGNLFQFNFYGTYYATDALYLDVLGTYGTGNNDSSRHIVIPGFADRIANGGFDTQTATVSFGGGYNFPFGALTLTPTARVEYRYTSSDGFTETGAQGLDLTYGSTSQSAFLSYIGGQAQYAISTEFGVLSPTVRANWAHQYNRGHSSMSIVYAHDPSATSAFVLAGDVPDRNYYNLGVGLAVQFAGNRSAFINYDAIVGLTGTSYNTFTAGMRFDF